MRPHFVRLDEQTWLNLSQVARVDWLDADVPARPVTTLVVHLLDGRTMRFTVQQADVLASALDCCTEEDNSDGE